MGSTHSAEHNVLATNNVEFVYRRVFQEVDIALTRGEYDRAKSMVRRAAGGHPKVIYSEEKMVPPR